MKTTVDKIGHFLFVFLNQLCFCIGLPECTVAALLIKNTSHMCQGSYGSTTESFPPGARLNSTCYLDLLQAEQR